MDEQSEKTAFSAEENGNEETGVDSAQEIITPEILNLDYRYVRLLGEGANGYTWLAKDRRNALDVAIKELKFADDLKALELFEREAEVLQAVQVRGVPRFYNKITHKGTSYIVQEYIPHPSLEYLLEKGKVFTEDEVYVILDKVSEILFALQTQYVPAIIHRDIKPGNIMYCAAERARDAQVWLIDFGAVDNAHKQSGGSTIAGTFGYMAPEQLQGEVSPRSDFYALGATALHLLTGVFPYNIPNELFQLKFHPVIKEKAPDTSDPMIELLDSLLSANVEKRPQSAQELRSAIREARAATVRYRELYSSLEVDEGPKNALSRLLFRFEFYRKLRKKYIDYKRERQIRLYKAEEERREAERKKDEESMERMRKFNGVDCICSISRISLAGGIDETVLEGVFQHEGNWYPAFILFSYVFDIRHRDPRRITLPPLTRNGIVIRCSDEVEDKKKISENTFRVSFLPRNNYTVIKENQVIWLDSKYYTMFTGLKFNKDNS